MGGLGKEHPANELKPRDLPIRGSVLPCFQECRYVAVAAMIPVKGARGQCTCLD